MNEEDKKLNEEINEINDNIEKSKLISNVDPTLTIGNSSIDKEELERKKIEALNNMIDNRINPLKELTLENSQKIDGIIGELQKIAGYLQQPQIAQQQEKATSMLSQLPPEMAANVLNGMLGGLAQLVQAWKSGGGNSEPNQFAQMSQEITTNLLRAGVDGIMQNVYHNYNPIPPRPSWNNQPPQPQRHSLE